MMIDSFTPHSDFTHAFFRRTHFKENQTFSGLKIKFKNLSIFRYRCLSLRKSEADKVALFSAVLNSFSFH